MTRKRDSLEVVVKVIVVVVMIWVIWMLLEKILGGSPLLEEINAGLIFGVFSILIYFFQRFWRFEGKMREFKDNSKENFKRLEGEMKESSRRLEGGMKEMRGDIREIPMKLSWGRKK